MPEARVVTKGNVDVILDLARPKAVFPTYAAAKENINLYTPLLII